MADEELDDVLDPEEEERRRSIGMPLADPYGGAAAHPSLTGTTIAGAAPAATVPMRDEVTPGLTAARGAIGTPMDEHTPAGGSSIFMPDSIGAPLAGPQSGPAPPPRPTAADYPAHELHGGRKALGAIFTGMGAFRSPQLGESIYNHLFEEPKTDAANQLKNAQAGYDTEFNQGQKALDDKSQRDLRSAQTDALRHPVPKPKEEEWSVVPGIQGPNGEPVQQEKNSGQVRVAPLAGASIADKHTAPETRDITRVVGGVPHTIMVDSRTGKDIQDEGQTKIPGESPGDKRAANESAQVEREARVNIRKAEGVYRDTQKSVGQLKSAIDAASDGNGLLTSFVPTMEVLGINAANGVHRISPTEAQAAQLPGGWAEQFNAWFDKATTGKISPQLKAEGKQLASILEKSSYQRYVNTHQDENGIVSGYGGSGFDKRVPLLQGPTDDAQQIPDGGGKKLDLETAKMFLQQAGGDKVKAAQLAKQRNWIE